MCYWVGTKKVREEMLRRLQMNPEDEIAQLFYKTFVGKADMAFREHFVAIGKARPEITVLIQNENHELEFRNMQWSLPWSYTDKKTGKLHTRELLNSTCEKAFFIHKESIFKKRCVIPLDGYYEFFHFSGEIYPHFLTGKQGLLFAGGVWDEIPDTETGEIQAFFSILTTPPNALTHKLHNNPKAPNGPRMLFLLPEDKALSFLDTNLDQESLKKLFLPFDENLMDSWPVPRFLRKEFAPRLNSEDVRARIDYPELFFA